MNDELYRTLGVKREATPEAIKKAHRKLVNQHHPDKGGDRVIFEQVQRAYDILSDPVKRALYDETGVADDVELDPTEANAMALIGGMINQAGVQPNFDVERVDLVERMRSSLEQSLGQARMGLDGGRLAIARLRKMRERIKRKTSGANVLLLMVDGSIANYERGQIMNAQKIKAHKRALEILKDYEYSTEAQQNTYLNFPFQITSSSV